MRFFILSSFLVFQCLTLNAALALEPTCSLAASSDAMVHVDPTKYDLEMFRCNFTGSKQWEIPNFSMATASAVQDLSDPFKPALSELFEYMYSEFPGDLKPMVKFVVMQDPSGEIFFQAADKRQFPSWERPEKCPKHLKNGEDCEYCLHHPVLSGRRDVISAGVIYRDVDGESLIVTCDSGKYGLDALPPAEKLNHLLRVQRLLFSEKECAYKIEDANYDAAEASRELGLKPGDPYLRLRRHRGK